MTDPISLAPGLTGSASLTVADRDTAIALRSGDVAVLATPRVVALAEQAACAALSGRLSHDMTTVGVRVEVDHFKPTAVGEEVTATATLKAVQGRKLDFEVTVRDADVEVARTQHRRVIAPRAAFPTSEAT